VASEKFDAEGLTGDGPSRANLQGFVNWWEKAKGLTFDPTLILDTDLLDGHAHRQKRDGVKPSTLNWARMHLLGFSAWV
jgi:hypothetical protein